MAQPCGKKSHTSNIDPLATMSLHIALPPFHFRVNGDGHRDKRDRPGITPPFHHHTPNQAAIVMPLHQPAVNQLRGNDLGWAAEEGVGQGWEIDRDGWVTRGGFKTSLTLLQPP